MILITLLLLTCNFLAIGSEQYTQPLLRERRNFNSLFQNGKQTELGRLIVRTSDATTAQQENTDLLEPQKSSTSSNGLQARHPNSIELQQPTKTKSADVAPKLPKNNIDAPRPTSAHRSYSPAIMPRRLLFTDDITLRCNPKTHAVTVPATIQQPAASTLLTVAMPDKCELPQPLKATCPLASKDNRIISVLRSYSPTIMPRTVTTTSHASSETQLPTFHSKPTRFTISLSDEPSVPMQKTVDAPNELQQENNFLKRALIAAAVAHHGDKKALLESEELQARKNLFALFLAHKRHAARQSSMTNAYSSRYTDNSKFKF